MLTEKATVLTVPALDLGINRVVNYMGLVCNKWAVSDGRVQVKVPTTGLLDPSAGDNPRGAINVAAHNLNDLLHSVQGPKVVFGYSQGAQVAGHWLRQFAHLPSAPPADEVSFLLIGNPERRFGQQPWTKKVTPDSTQYRVLDVARVDDRWANYKEGDPKNKFAAMFGGTHTDYWHVDLSNGPVVRGTTVGRTVYLVVP